MLESLAIILVILWILGLVYNAPQKLDQSLR
ncbi:DUF5670 family protein [Methylicorpusculum sp.]